MRAFNVTLSDRHRAFIDRQLADGRAHNASEVVRQAIELAIRDGELHEAKLASLRQALAPADAEIDRGEARSFEVEEVGAVFDAAIAARQPRL